MHSQWPSISFSAEAIQEPAVLDAVQQVHQGEAVVPSLQALQLQINQYCNCMGCSDARLLASGMCLHQLTRAALPDLPT